MSTLSIQSNEKDGIFYLSGEIDAHTDLSLLFDSQDDHLTLNLKGVTNIYSIGAKKWLEGVRDLRRSGKGLIYIECSEIFVEFFNISPAFTQDVRIQSFEVAFMCESCDQYKSQMIVLGNNLAFEQPTIVCPQCGTEMITEEEDVFRFLENL
ncbi:MAG: hypothetical protein HQM11_15070 [SAR324 cluster bacterium]|nr:hypothetical protein [SAR324 cluster bacterium]